MPSTETGKFRQKAGRREKPLPDDGTPRTVLAASLRELKRACGSPTYDELATLSRVYKTGLIDAARATRLPPWYVVEGYVEGCWAYHDSTSSTSFTGAGDLSRWQQLYRNAGGAIPGDFPTQVTGERSTRLPESQPAPAVSEIPAARGMTEAQSAAGKVTHLIHSWWAGMRSGRRHRFYAVAGTTAAMMLIAGAVAGFVAMAGASPPPRSAPAGPWMRLAVESLDTGYRHPLDTTTIPAASLQPDLAQWLGEHAAAGNVIGYQLRSAYPASTVLCLTAVTSGQTAGQDGGGVEASPCTRSAPSQIWIPVQYEVNGSSYTWLANDQYQSKCLNADNREGGVHQESRVQLWDCYLPRLHNFSHFNEAWDFGTWLHAMQSGATSYPLFLGAGNYSLDADDNSLKSGLPAAPLSIIDHYTVSWEYWY